jgi:hypothetical protein
MANVPVAGQFEPMYHHMVRLFEILNANITTVDVFAPDDPPDIEPKRFEEWLAMLSTSGFPKNVNRLVLTSILPLMNKTIVVSSFGLLDKGFSLSFDSLVSGFDRAYFEDTARSTWEHYRFDYGYALQLPRETGSWFYGSAQMGYFASPSTRKNLRWAKHWAKLKTEGRPLDGSLRDIYLMNFLTEQHLEVSGLGVPVGSWIAQGAARGTLKRLNDDIWIWDLPCRRLPAVRKAFAEAGLLVSCGRDEL